MRTRHLYRTAVAVTITAAITVALSGCATEQPRRQASNSTASPSAAKSCVHEPEALITSTLSVRATEPVDDGLAARLDSAAAGGFAEAAAPGAIVAVQTPEGTWKSAYGESDPGAGTEMTLGVHHRIGSVTKTFTGTLILQLAEEDKLSLDDTVDQYFDGVTYGDTITIEMLLDMTSGISSYSLDDAFVTELFGDPEKIWTPEQLIDLGISLPPQFPPGEKFDYSNTNFIMLGRIAEMATGESFKDLVHERIIVPLGLAGTTMPAAEEVALPSPNERGFTLQGTEDDSFTPIDATGWNPTWGWTAGQMTSTIDDLLVYGRALATGEGILKPDTQLDRLTAMAPGGGYGWASGCIDGWFGHTGELPGFNTSVYYDSQTDSTVVVATNSDIPSGDCPESKTLPDDPRTATCMAPAVRIFVAVSAVLGHQFTPNPMS